MAQHVDLADAEISAAVHRPPLVSELEPLGRQESAVGRQAAWTRHLHDVACYATWADGAVESEVEAIKRSMNPNARLRLPEPDVAAASESKCGSTACR
jgi:hypothetical protein